MSLTFVFNEMGQLLSDWAPDIVNIQVHASLVHALNLKTSLHMFETKKQVLEVTLLEIVG